LANKTIFSLVIVSFLLSSMLFSSNQAFAVLVNGVDETTLGTFSPQAVVSQQACHDIDYIFTGTGSGSLGATNFIGADFSVRIWSNTCDVVAIGSSIFNVGALMAEVEVDGVGTASVTQETGVFSNTGGCDCVGWGEFIGNINQGDIYDLFGVGVAAASYDLTTDFGPGFDPFPEGFFSTVSTDAGIFDVSNISDGSFVAQLKIPVGGELIPLDTTSLLLAGTQMNAAWMIPVIVSAIGIGIVIARKF